MNASLIARAAAASGLSAFAPLAGAEPFVVQPVGVTASSSAGSYASPVLMINGEGLAGGAASVVAGSPIPNPWPGHSIWWAHGTYLTEVHAITPTIVFDLGASYSLRGMHFWNSNLDPNPPWTAYQMLNCGIKTAVVSVSEDDVSYTPVTLTGLDASGYFAMGTGAPEYAYRGEEYGFSADNVRFVKVDVLNNWGGDYTAIAEVRFTAISEPECPSCAADYDNNGGVDGGDLGAFFLDFEAGETCADVDQNGGVDGGDLGYFFTVFEAGGC